MLGVGRSLDWPDRLDWCKLIWVINAMGDFHQTPRNISAPCNNLTCISMVATEPGVKSEPRIVVSSSKMKTISAQLDGSQIADQHPAKRTRLRRSSTYTRALASTNAEHNRCHKARLPSICDTSSAAPFYLKMWCTGNLFYWHFDCISGSG